MVEKSGSWFSSYAGQRIGQGRENAKTWLKDHPEEAAGLERTIRDKAGVGGGEGIDLLESEPGSDE